jgi:hypothetical protein
MDAETRRSIKVQVVKSLGNYINMILDKREGKVEEKTERKRKTPATKKIIDPSEPFACAGNVIDGTPCPTEETDGSNRATDTRVGKTNHQTCKTCKKAIAASRRAAKESVTVKKEESIE